MKNAMLEENKGRWMLFEQVSPMSSGIIWGVLAALVVLGAVFYAYVLT